MRWITVQGFEQITNVHIIWENLNSGQTHIKSGLSYLSQN